MLKAPVRKEQAVSIHTLWEVSNSLISVKEWYKVQEDSAQEFHKLDKILAEAEEEVDSLELDLANNLLNLYKEDEEMDAVKILTVVEDKEIHKASQILRHLDRV